MGGFLTGGPIGAIAGGLKGVGVNLTPTQRPSAAPPSGSPFGIGGGINIGGPYGITARGGTGAWNDPGSAVAASGMGGCPRGYHLNKHALSASRAHGAVAARSICVRNRHTNPLNPHALRRALAREKRARKLLSKLHVFKPVHHRAPTRKR